MFNCPKCGSTSKSRSSRGFTRHVKERYSVCTHHQCQCVFKTFEFFDRFITKTVDPKQVKKAAMEPQPAALKPVIKRERYVTRLE
ncbi:ogr/Delta-like zinc finger family protein [Yersinia ruckeri]|uniref:ogr/Delta-like zinc finger family protein n=1 Tax=Yersinia ruckeri TaxID=29486 RepID=UPI00223711E6|nr:ogr/Delta-like zinc finger family protein [Yersinia ruckeri]MCW6542996.1 ogr/Delta-like zinc finger family protein [Yersinia ruckeri]MCW6591422.1 ogr/Delta-like zinc finger family protein [Yersinia ruckeri]UZX90870.1 ogr/Delta-like zinc finger family protein [Yersinia ruckeri]